MVICALVVAVSACASDPRLDASDAAVVTVVDLACAAGDLLYSRRDIIAADGAREFGDVHCEADGRAADTGAG
jgi:hypothetical protein